ncbi:putative helicase [Agrobacterium rubi TR3 = NBRC 13261]|uniref:Putative helicase n=1 Tax=Agrobacterium rubi TR3 = NBRC 13261 TaxID=1368415 RepID=A0A081D120_9HYPH|nr:SNF2-related protein [Agrobacterium rubi]MBP1880445.1 SNF2 family DNA or RNA helicase [Agrobacterium rubi]GAK72616.1 putative helicase [Agrobacterium rubi TR3 = NBRC 13261]
MTTDYHAKLYAHELSRRHSVADARKLAAALLDAQVDLNPHQVEAALFAFKSPLSKGAILADEVGLGKTIEAGLVIAQKWTQGQRRILIITPANLRKQWSQELEEKFFLPSMILEAKNYNKLAKSGVRCPFEQKAIVVCSFQFAARWADELMVIPWDLVVIDEAHRLRNVYRPDNRIGRALKTALANAPKVLLTATPLQNSMMELYGLVSLIDDYAFGDAKSFRSQYARITGDEQFDELKERLKPVCHRTLRRQVLEYIRYTNRIPITQEFVPSEPEQALYDMVSDYLRRPELQALPSSQRTLMTLIMRKLLASSTFAIAGALDSLARKLERQLRDDTTVREKLVEEIAEDYEEYDDSADEWPPEGGDEPELLSEVDIANISQEISDLRAFRDLAVSIAENAKGVALLSALRAGFEKAQELGSAENAIIFTESRRTQDYLVRLLSDNGYDGKLVLFNGSNSDLQSKAIYNSWVERHKGTDRITGSKTADMRAALVEYFREKASIMIATEAAAEGINLQFCSMVVNYDLPWNPQRIEQRIGRCHRYGQRHDVVVVNFLNKNNAADQRVYELLAEKFKLFSGVFGASDEVLGAIESGIEFEKRIVSIYQTCRSEADIEHAFERLRGEMEVNISVTMEDTRRKLLENFDAEVHDRLKINMAQSKSYIDRYERMLWAVTKHELGKSAKFDDDYLTFMLKARPDGVDAPAGSYFLSKQGIDGHRYRLGHPLAQYLLSLAASRQLNGAELIFDYTAWPQTAVAIAPFIGRSGTLVAHKLLVRGSDDQDHLIIAAMTDDGARLDSAAAMRLFEMPSHKKSMGDFQLPESVKATIDNERQTILDEMARRQSIWFDEEIDKLDNWAEDRRAGLKADLKDLDEQIKSLKKDVRQTGNLPEKLALQRKARVLETQRDEAWRAYDAAAKDIEVQKDGLLDQVEERLSQAVSDEELFTIRFGII